NRLTYLANFKGDLDTSGLIQDQREGRIDRRPEALGACLYRVVPDGNSLNSVRTHVVRLCTVIDATRIIRCRNIRISNGRTARVGNRPDNARRYFLGPSRLQGRQQTY